MLDTRLVHTPNPDDIHHPFERLAGSLLGGSRCYWFHSSKNDSDELMKIEMMWALFVLHVPFAEGGRIC